MVFTSIDQSLTPSVQLNIIDNGGMEIWQRGITFSNPTSYTADRWNISTSCTTYSIAQESGAANVDSGIYSMKLVITTPSGGVFRIGQSPENPTQYIGKTMSYSARVKSNIAGVKLFVSYSGGQTASTIGHTGDNTWQTLSMTILIPNAGLTFSIGFDSVNTTVGTSVSPSAGTFYVDGVSMVAGSNAAVYIPLTLQQDLARCQRFFYATPVVNNMFICHGQCQNATTSAYIFRFPVSMRIAPTLTVNNTTNFTTWDAGGNPIALTSLFNAGGGANTDTYLLQGLVASGLVAGNATSLRTTSNAQLFFSADF
jgi:hypothetical protein